MKAVMITYDQAHHEAVIDVLTKTNNRGYTAWNEVTGRGTRTGDPHLGSHAWPTTNAAVFTVVEDHRLKPLLDGIRELDTNRPLLGIHAYAWTVEDFV